MFLGLSDVKYNSFFEYKKKSLSISGVQDKITNSVIHRLCCSTLWKSTVSNKINLQTDFLD